MTWTQDPSLEYWIFYAAAAVVTPQNYNQFPTPKVQRSVNSPLTITGLTNGTTYAFVMNSTHQAGPAGPATASIAITPSAAGNAWTLGPRLITTASGTTPNLNGVALNSSSIGVAVGVGGTIFSTTDFSNWVPQNSTTSNDLNAITNGATATSTSGTTTSTFVAVGVNGTVVTSGDAITWTASASNATVSLNGAAYGASVYVVVGDGGTILTSSDAASGSWTPRVSGTTNNLYGVAFLNNATFVAVGANGTLLTSTDGQTWTPRASNTSVTLRGAANVAAPDSSASPTYVVVGAGGTILSSADAVTWTVQTPDSHDLYSVAASTQFVAVGAGGTILVGLPGTSWSRASSGTSSDLLSTIRVPAIGFAAVGAAGANVTSGR